MNLLHHQPPPSLLNPSLPSNNNSPTITTTHDGFNISTTSSRSHSNTKPIHSNNTVSTTKKSSTNSNNTNDDESSSSSMTLAISHENAKRMLEASRAFNISLDRLKEDTKRKEMEEEIQRRQHRRKSRESSLSRVADKVVGKTTKTDGAGETSMEEDTIKTESTNEGDGETTTDGGATVPTEEQQMGGGTTDNNSSSPPHPKATTDGEPLYPNNDDNHDDDDDEPTPKTKSIDKLLVPAALASDNNLLCTYVKQMQRAHAEGTFSMLEIEVCLLLFLDMDKSNKLLSAFELLSKWAVIEEKEEEKKNEEDDKQQVLEEDEITGGDTVVTNDLEGDVSMNPASPSPLTTTTTTETDGTKSSSQSLDDSTKITPEEKGSTTTSSPTNTLPPSNNSNDEGEKAMKMSCTPTTDTKKTTTTTEGNSTTTALSSPSPSPPTSPPVLKLPTLDRNQLIRLFRCFLSSISTCIHHQDDGGKKTDQQQRSRKVAKGGKCDSPSSAVARKISMESPPPLTSSTTANKNDTSHTTTIDDNDNLSPSLITSSGVPLEEVGSSKADESMSITPYPPSTTSSSSSQNTKDWTLSSETEHEIREIANYATDRIIEYVRTKKFTPSPSFSSSNTSPTQEPSSPTSSPALVSINFSVFGDWYNSGGFSLVPWLELLDLAKWDYAGRAAAAAAAAAKGISKHTTGRGASGGLSGGGSSREYSSPNAMMDPIMEEGGGGEGEFGGKVERREPQSCSVGGGRFGSGSGGGGEGGLEVDGGTNLFFNSPRSIKPKVAVASRTLISFDFGSIGGASGAVNNGNNERQPAQRPSARHSIDITADNLSMLQNLVTRTSLCKCTPEHVAKVLLRHSKRRRIPVSASSSRTGMAPRLEEVMMVLSRQDFGRCIRDLVPPEASRAFSDAEMETFSNFFTNFFLCFGRINSNSAAGLDIEHVNVRELIVGFSFLCKGNKSAKLGTIFEVIEEQNVGFLSQRKLMRYLRSYLTMLVGISLLSSSAKSTTETRRALLAVEQSIGLYDSLFAAAESGARWTLDHFLRGHEAKMKKSGGGGRSANNGMISFEDFASWYTEEGGYKIAPWLEFLDLKKFLSLLTDDTTHQQQEKLHSRSTNTSTASVTTARGNGNGSSGSQPTSDRITRTFDENPNTSTNNTNNPTKNKASTTRPNRPAPSRPIHAPYPPAPSADVLFTFPLANRHSLVVLRADAAYVRTVVNQLGLLSKAPEEVWGGLYRHVQDSPPSPLAWRYAQHHNSGTGKSLDVDQATFVTALEGVVPKVVKRKRLGDNKSSSSAKDTLTNFFQSFDLDQVDRVAANQLMGGLTLLCGGKKSAKLAFSFGLFDGRTKEEKKGKDNQSLRGKELFYFLRSFLIVMFSCCKQSLDLSADAVGRYISDTANMVTDDVMKYLWRERRSERVDFEQFGEWYNEGGFETAPWLELLDLNKWVLLDEAKAKENEDSTATTAAATKKNPKERAAPKRPQLQETKNLKVNIVKVKKEKETMEMTPKKPEILVETKDILSEPLSECPPPPPDDILDPTSDMFFDDMGMDDIDFLFHDTSGKDKENIDTTPNIGSVAILDPSILPKIEGNGGVGEPKVELEQHLESSTESKPLKFHLLTSDNQSGYIISISPRRVRLLKHLITESDLFNVNISAACEKIFAEAIDGKLKKDMFDAAMRQIIALSDTGGAKMTTDTQRLLSDLLSSVYAAFDLNKAGEVDARELACGFTVLCGGRKSDKLEYAFELLDGKKSGLFSRADMVLYLQSFLTVLLSISSCAIGRESSEDILGTLNGTTSSVSRVIGWGASWATEQVFKSTPRDQKVIKGDVELINFDNFADWYTKGGYTSIQWLELLDLRKWVLAEV